MDRSRITLETHTVLCIIKRTRLSTAPGLNNLENYLHRDFFLVFPNLKYLGLKLNTGIQVLFLVPITFDKIKGTAENYLK